MKRVVLFRFHKNLAVCKNKLALIKKFNPDVPMYGLYGGPIDDPEGMQKGLKDELLDIYSFADKPDMWKWKNGDLATRLWHQHIGHRIEFDVLHSLEWDLLLWDSLDNVYKGIPPDTLGLTALVRLSEVESEWSWTRQDKPVRQEWLNLLSYAQKAYGYKEQPFASLGPGTCFPRAFLDKYVATSDIPEYCHEELRLPLFAQIFGIPLTDTGFYKKWFSAPERKYFNCRGEEVLLSTIQGELEKPDGRRVFHPVREIVEI